MVLSQFWSTKWTKHTGGIGIGKEQICAPEWLPSLPQHKMVKFI
jgi:hypothetical protein